MGLAQITGISMEECVDGSGNIAVRIQLACSYRMTTKVFGAIEVSPAVLALRADPNRSVDELNQSISAAVAKLLPALQRILQSKFTDAQSQIDDAIK